MTPLTEAPTPDAANRRQALDLVIAAVRAGQIDEARRLTPEALRMGAEHPLLLNLRALDHEDAGRFDEALTDLRRAHVLAPSDVSTLNACGLCLGRLHRPAEAIACFEQAVSLAPDFGPAWFNRGWTLEHLGRLAEARQSYEKAVALEPRHAQAWANLAMLAAKRGDLPAAKSHAAQALALQPDLATGVLALAEAELGEPAKSEARLRALLALDLTAYDRGLAFGLLGDALDAQDRPAEAFDAYAKGNAAFRHGAAAQFETGGQATIPDTLAWLNRWARRLEAKRWNTRSPGVVGTSEAAGHVFLLGFPRSGTTLIETVLANHPGVVTLEERNTFHASVLDFLTDTSGLHRLASASDLTLQRYREDYWVRVRQDGVDPAGKVFIDKNPFNTLKLPLIFKLFPNAKIIFALRDPRDVVLSCFRRRFNLNASTYEFLDLERTARNYDETMRFAMGLGAKQDMAEFRLVYEDLIADFEGVARAACAFIGVDWREDLIDIAARGRRGDVASASSAQIARGLFADGAGQWRRYQPQLASVLPVLAPWVETFSYPPA